jgi:hypothetical protein
MPGQEAPGELDMLAVPEILAPAEDLVQHLPVFCLHEPSLSALPPVSHRVIWRVIRRSWLWSWRRLSVTGPGGAPAPSGGCWCQGGDEVSAALVLDDGG